MYEIKENSRILKDGTELTTYTRDVVSANILEVEAGTTGYQGGDSGHGGRTYFRIEDAASTDMEVRSYVNKYGCPGFEVVLGGDCELETTIRALKFITKVLEEEAAEVYDWCSQFIAPTSPAIPAIAPIRTGMWCWTKPL